MTGSEPGGTHPWIRVRNAALEYVGVGWFLSQVVAVMGRQFGWSSKVGDFVVIGLGVGFVVTMSAALIMARRPVAPGSGRRGLIFAGVAALAALGVWLLSGGISGVRTGRSGLVHESRGLFSTAGEVDGFFVVHPQEPLAPTGIRVRPGQTISVSAQGRVNIALARLVEAMEAGDGVAYAWVGPRGEVDPRGLPVLRRDRGRPGRERCLVNAAFPYGALLALLTPSERITPGTARGLRPDREIFAVGSHLETRAELGGFLSLAVNDIYLDREECDPDAFAAGRDPDAFFRDNIGFFSVRVEVR